jgi:hypothetical protein
MEKSTLASWDYRVFGLCTLSGVLMKTVDWKLDCSHPQAKGWEVPTLLGPLERANL